MSNNKNELVQKDSGIIANVESHFSDILKMIEAAKQKVAYEANTTMIDLYWNIGEYISAKSESDGWGKSTVYSIP